MFDVGFFEIVLLAVVGIIVIGPERLPEVTRKAMLWRGRLKRQFSDIKTVIEKEIGADDIRQTLHNEKILKEIDEGKHLVDDLKHEMQSLNDTMTEKIDECVKK